MTTFHAIAFYDSKAFTVTPCTLFFSEQRRALDFIRTSYKLLLDFALEPIETVDTECLIFSVRKSELEFYLDLSEAYIVDGLFVAEQWTLKKMADGKPYAGIITTSEGISVGGSSARSAKAIDLVNEERATYEAIALHALAEQRLRQQVLTDEQKIKDELPSFRQAFRVLGHTDHNAWALDLMRFGFTTADEFFDLCWNELAYEQKTEAAKLALSHAKQTISPPPRWATAFITDY